jgi:hypothetical protein
MELAPVMAYDDIEIEYHLTHVLGRGSLHVRGPDRTIGFCRFPPRAAIA